MMFETVRGYAVTFNEATWLAPVPEIVDRRAFNAMLADMDDRTVNLIWGSHEADAPMLASTVVGSLTLFADSYGLGFTATVNCDRAAFGWREAMMRRNQGVSRCSVNFNLIKQSRVDDIDGKAVTRILDAEIDHIAIVDRAAYPSTAAWLPRRLDGTEPSRLRNLNSRWERGRRASDFIAACRARKAVDGIPAPVREYIEACEPDYTAMRERIDEAVRRGGVNAAGGEGLVMGHLALSRAAMLVMQRKRSSRR